MPVSLRGTAEAGLARVKQRQSDQGNEFSEGFVFGT